MSHRKNLLPLNICCGFTSKDVSEYFTMTFIVWLILHNHLSNKPQRSTLFFFAVYSHTWRSSKCQLSVIMGLVLTTNKNIEHYEITTKIIFYNFKLSFFGFRANCQGLLHWYCKKLLLQKFFFFLQILNYFFMVSNQNFSRDNQQY